VSDLLTWQIVDSAFPTGAFSHSWGLEAAWQFGEVPDVHALRAFVDASIVQSGHAYLPFMNEAYRDPESIEAFDALADAFRTLMATAARVWPSDRLTRLQARAAGTCAHIAPLSGAVFQSIGLPLPTAQHVVLYGTVRSVLSAAVRLGVIGGFEAQRLQYACGQRLEEIANRCAALSIDDVAQTAPMVDLLQAGHDRLYSRLFQS
jgi:urease accessory protein